MRTPSLASALALAALLAPPATRAADPAPPDLAGRWALLQVEAEVRDVPTVGEVTTTTRALALVDVTQEGTALTLSARACAIRAESDSPAVKTTLPPAFVRAMPQAVRPATLRWAKGRWAVRGPERAVVLGARLGAPETEALPDKARDPRVTDGDGDGQPGVTVRISGLVTGDVYMAQRRRTAFEGLVRDADRVDGLVTWRSEQTVLGATNLFLKANVTPRPHADRTRHAFKLRRVPAGTDCEGVVRDAARVFGR